MLLNIPDFINNDDYLQGPVIKKFCNNNNLKVCNTRPDGLKQISDFADTSEDNMKKVEMWIDKVIKEGSKELCYKEINFIPEEFFYKKNIEEKLKEKYKDCTFDRVVTYKNSNNRRLINYEIFEDDGKVEMVSFCFSSFVLVKNEEGETPTRTVYPIFVDLYFKERYIVSRAKSKSTIYEYMEDAKDVDDLRCGTRINTEECAVECIDEILNAVGLKCEEDSKRVINRNSHILYELYQRFTFTPKEVTEKISAIQNFSNEFINKLFNTYKLDIKNKEMAVVDLNIFVEKYISINGENSKLFKEGREAYLIKVGANDELDLTSIDAKSNRRVPLQTKPAFFDSKKSVLTGEKCKKLTLCFKRRQPKYFGREPIEVQFYSKKKYGVIKFMLYAEEEDIVNVLQYFFESSRRY